MILALFYFYFICQIFEILFVTCAKIFDKLKTIARFQLLGLNVRA
jgi:hypothetical protein